MACDKQKGMEKLESDIHFLGRNINLLYCFIDAYSIRLIFADKCGASNSLKDIILELAQVQPQDSISFIID